MPLGYLFLVVAACVLFAMAIDSVLTSFTLLNISAAVVLLGGAVIAGSTGLSEFFLLGNTQWLSVTMIKTQNAAVCFMGFAFLFLSFHFPRDRKMPNTRVYLVPALLVTALLVAFSLLGWDIQKTYYLSSSGISAPRFFDIRVTYNALHYVMQTLSVLLAAASIFWIVTKYRKASLVYQRKQIRYFLSGVALFLLTLFFLLVLGKVLPAFLKYPLLSAAAVIAGGSLLFTVVTYRFVNLRKSVGLFIRDNAIGLVVALPLAILLFIIRPWLQVVSLAVYFAVMPPVLVLFFWLFELSRELLKRVLRLRTMKQDITESFLDRIGPSRSVGELARNTVNVLVENINCRNADFLAFDPDKETYQTVHSSGGKNYSISAIDPFFRYLKPDVEIYDREAVNFDPSYSSLRDNAERYFEKHETSLIVPVFYEDHATVILNIAGKIDNTSFTANELNLIAKLRKIVQVVLNNIILFENEQEAQLNKRDLSLASVIQESIFQKVIPEFTSMDVAAFLKPARGVSGDYFLVQKVNNNSMGVIIADVAGKGFPASLISMMIHTVAKSQEFSSVTTNAIVAKINDVMTSNQDNTRLTRTLNFATVFCGFIDYSVKTLFYTNAGHNPMISYDPAAGVFDSIRANGKPPGIFPDQVYLSGTYRFAPGRIFVLYSDGITESINAAEEEFGVERLQALIRENAGLTAEKISDAILGAVEAYTGDLEQFDDITLVVIKL
jgi:serine phosphatase RsbU (regulator of sigma subunit)